MTGYTGYSGDTTKQSGNFLALKLDADDSATVSIMLGTKGPVDATDDMYVVARIDDPTEKLVITATKSGKSETKSYDLSELVLKTA